MLHSFENFQFEIGDIVRESDLIAWSSDGPLLGLIINIKRDQYRGYSTFYEDSLPIDKVTVLWFKEGFIESLPSDLLILITRDPFYQNIKS